MSEKELRRWTEDGSRIAGKDGEKEEFGVYWQIGILSLSFSLSIVDYVRRRFSLDRA